MVAVAAAGTAGLDARGGAGGTTHQQQPQQQQQQQRRRRRHHARGPASPTLLLLLLLAACGMAAHTFIGVHAFLTGGAPDVPPHVAHTHVRPARTATRHRSSDSGSASSTISSGGARLSSRVLLQASGGDSADALVAEVRKMRAAAIKDELKARGVPTAGIVDKDDLVALLVRSRQQQPAAPTPPPSPSAGGGGAAAAAGAGGATKGYAAARVPFRQRTPPSTLPGGGTVAQGPKSYICVDLAVGGQALEFLVDSGATPTIVTERTRARLGLQPLGGGQRLEGVTATGAGAAPRVMLNDCRLGGQSGCVVNMDALVMGNEGVLPSGVDGLLGVKWMQYHGVVDIDFRTMTLSVFPYDARARDTGSTELADLLDDVSPELLARGVPMRQDPMSAIFFVDVNLGGPSGPPVPAIVDLGAGMSMVNWMAAGQVGVTPSSPNVIKNQMQVWGIDGRTVPVDLYDFRSMYLAGRVPLARSRVGVADLPAFGLIGYGNRPVGVVGMDMLSGSSDPSTRRIIFDFRRNMLYCA